MSAYIKEMTSSYYTQMVL